MICPTCNGTKGDEVEGKRCPTCQGTGEVQKKRVEVVLGSVL